MNKSAYPYYRLADPCLSNAAPVDVPYASVCKMPYRFVSLGVGRQHGSCMYTFVKRSNALMLWQIHLEIMGLNIRPPFIRHLVDSLHVFEARVCKIKTITYLLGLG